MWPGLLWFALLTAAMLCYPRRPRTAGALWITLGLMSMVLSFLHGAGLAKFSGLFFVGLGVCYLVKYRKPEVREKHVDYWTAKA
jgi:hypothetical protein